MHFLNVSWKKCFDGKKNASKIHQIPVYKCCKAANSALFHNCERWQTGFKLQIANFIILQGLMRYSLTFVQYSDGRWYIDMPWDGNRGNLEMVAGSDNLLSFLDKSLTGGSHYDSTTFEDSHISRIRICPVTLCVLGRYRKYLYIKEVA